ncbi:hypothetical protein [Nocardioides sp. Kera G14]|uniref:hypothetical protein n=1 Tax=Nocardioides sp. Kera G14 TaxID=2884264 RepID=UPI001D11EC33|nr:hypothetical protein [Nocardioides sp. Kera G14]UDY23182.1 hypothetical protein LH076_14100 [Nocardioides sp. Kera G14]
MTPARPRQITIAAWLIIAGSIFTVLTIAEQFQSLGSMQMDDAIERTLGRPPFDTLDVSVDQIESMMRVLGMVAAACATAAAILGWQVLQHRSTTARLWLSILALPLLVAGFASGGFTSTMVVVATVMLWLQPARDWLAGTWKPAPAPAERAVPHLREGTSSPQAPAHSDVSERPFGEKAGPERPTALLSAVILTWIFSLLAAAGFVLAAGVLIADPGWVIDQLERTNPDLMAQEGMTERLIQVIFVLMSGVVLAWSISACVLAFLVLRRVAWARIVLMVCAGCAGLVLIVGAVANPLLIAPLVASAVTIGLLARRDVADYLRR